MLWRQPPLVVGAVLAANLVAASVLVIGVLAAPTPPGIVLRDALIVGLAISFEEIARNVARLRKRLVDVGYEDMSSIWQFAAAAALPTGHAVSVVLVLCLYTWFRHDRRLGKHGYRESYSGSVHVIAVAAAGATVHSIAGLLAPDFASFVAICAGIGTLLLVSRVMIFGMIGLASGRMSASILVGTTEDYGIELATLSLGGLTGLALASKPLLAVLVLFPAYALQRGALVRELEVAASHDPKTGLLNPMAWQTLAKRELSRAQREGQPAAVLILDLDHFKRVNDQWGHVAGDAVLKAVGLCMREVLRNYDSIGRFGGEEFVAILPDVDEFQGAVIAERLRRRIGQLRIASIAETTNNPTLAAESDHTLSTSVGVACFPEHGLQLDQLLLGADGALYRAKERGRNRVEFADFPGPETRELVSE